MKKGDVVTVNDYSWAKEVVNGKLKNVRIKDCTTRKYTIVENNCDFPLHDDQSRIYRSDTVIQAIDGGEVIFIHGTFLRPVPPKHKIIIDVENAHPGHLMCGKFIEISDKLYEEIKRDSQS